LAAGESVQIEALSPAPKKPAYKYVVLSKKLGKKFRLSDADAVGWLA
jgi:hypothetical protein